MIYYFRYDVFKWCLKEYEPKNGDLYVAFHMDFPQYGLRYMNKRLQENTYHVLRHINQWNWEEI